MSCEIEEESPSRYGHGGVTNLDGIREEIETERRSSEFSGGGDHDGGAAVYVAVGNATKGCEESSMDALRWALKHAVTHPPSSFLVFLVNIFPETKHIPSPLGMIPMSQVNPEQKENHMAQERSKRSQFLHKFLDVCSASQVKVETILVESDTEAKAILDLIPICNIQKLVLGISKPNLRRMRSKRGSCTADQILQNAPEFCQVKIICEGKEVATDQLESPSPSPSPGPSPRSAHGPRHHQNQTTQSESVGCSCFKAKVFQ
ncbi:PREDICTED: putative U-box domain-containing protein 50 [Ipomoea nil]|uniref:putative U-box domain-containing protein 50 n=1 Tax=Ipomoea nil TaxID=35883 RepID=UPI000900DD53|nr:PREDICTED: putative U-box domain-containing protein 50 [Ipomoea nil]